MATILAELHEDIDGIALANIAELSPIAWAQRLGYLLDLVGAQDKAEELARYIAHKKPIPTPLVSSQPFGGISPLKRWNILVNARVEAEV